MLIDIHRERNCVVCFKELPERARLDTRTCSARCRQRLKRLRAAHDRQARIEAAQKDRAPLSGHEAALGYQALLAKELKRVRRAGKAVAAPSEMLPDALRATVWLALAEERYGKVLAAIHALADSRLRPKLEKRLLEGLSLAATHLRQMEAAVKQAQEKERKP